MKRIPLLVAVLTVASASVAAQRNDYSFDNFDVRNGVKTVEPVVNTTKPAAGKPGKSRSKTMPTGKSISASPIPTSPLVAPTLLTTGLNATEAVANTSALRGYTTGSSEVDGYLIQAGKSNGVDPLLLYSVMHQESSFKSRAISPKGARGLMQLMPGTAMRYGVTNIFDPRQNIEGGARYLRFLLDHFDGDVNLALAGYNAGEGAVEKYGWRIPPYAETQEYVRRISRRYSLLQDPSAAAYARPVSRTQLSRLQARDPEPLTLYERTVSVVRSPDGKLQLMSQ
ncbi:MAG TPA: lytic transglycosylase domain-containing protein [Pyrinomonadaceae bacterium]|nr:lytic transglycosylase domain-containing protein [Pyrinomonadaceae bacterium]